MYGSDFYLDENGDIVFTPEGDVQTETTNRLIAQDLKEEASIPYGSLPWDPAAGSHFFEMLNNAGFQDEDAVSELERLALKDPRIDATSVKAERRYDGKFSLTYMPLGNFPEEVLLFDLDTLFLGDTNE